MYPRYWNTKKKYLNYWGKYINFKPPMYPDPGLECGRAWLGSQAYSAELVTGIGRENFPCEKMRPINLPSLSAQHRNEQIFIYIRICRASTATAAILLARVNPEFWNTQLPTHTHGQQTQVRNWPALTGTGSLSITDSIWWSNSCLSNMSQHIIL